MSSDRRPDGAGPVPGGGAVGNGRRADAAGWVCARTGARVLLASGSAAPATAGAADPEADRAGHGDPAAGTESALAEVLAGVVHADSVSADSHFFDELGADSLVMAHFCARVRKRADLPSVSMKDVYRHPTIRSLATALADTGPVPAEQPSPAAAQAAPVGTPQYVLCGTLQLLVFLGYSYLVVLAAAQGYGWIAAGSGPVDVYLRSILVGGVGFLGMCTLPILVKWVLVGRWKPQQIRIWSPTYVRFWIVKTLLRSNPLILFAGSPIYVLYLRALGAKVGRGAAVFSRNAPVCTDLLTVGDSTVIRKDSFFTCYRAHAGLIQTGAVTLGRDVFVGEGTVIDIDTSMGDGAQLGHASSLHSGQAVPAGECWNGSPAQRAEADYRAVGPIGCGTARKAWYSFLQLLTALVLYLPLVVGGVGVLVAAVPWTSAFLDPGQSDLTGWAFYRDALVGSFVLFFGVVLVGLLCLLTVPRLLDLAIEPDRVYPLYGFHYGIHRAIARMTNVRFFAYLFGDSSCIVHYLRSLGYDLSRVEQTGSNFGQRVKHETPYLSSVGSGTMVADGLSVINTDFSSTSFRMTRTSIGPRNFLGNNIFYPSQGRTGDNCLLATKVMVPVDGEVRENVGLLGSPSFEIPRTVLRDSRFEIRSRDELRRRLAAKNRHNTATMGLYLLVRWIEVCGIALLVEVAACLHASIGAAAIALGNALVLLFSVLYFVLVERVVTGLQALRPQGCSIYERCFWRHERFWKVPAQAYLRMFDGTPFKNAVWRLLGVRLGRRVFDDGCGLVEKTFVTIGDDCTLNAGSIIQCHSQEDGAFKSDRSTIGAGCTLGIGAFVHYGVTMGEGAVLAPDSFLMKGEVVPRRARWEGNPAREVRDGADTSVGGARHRGSGEGR